MMGNGGEGCWNSTVVGMLVMKNGGEGNGGGEDEGDECCHDGEWW